jgi:hypothetical protein
MNRSFLAYAVGMMAVTAVLAQEAGTKLEQQVYLPKCSGSWYIESQGNQDGSDWVKLTCTDYPEESQVAHVNQKWRGRIIDVTHVESESSGTFLK